MAVVPSPHEERNAWKRALANEKITSDLAPQKTEIDIPLHLADSDIKAGLHPRTELLRHLTLAAEHEYSFGKRSGSSNEVRVAELKIIANGFEALRQIRIPADFVECEILKDAFFALQRNVTDDAIHQSFVYDMITAVEYQLMDSEHSTPALRALACSCLNEFGPEHVSRIPGNAALSRLAKNNDAEIYPQLAKVAAQFFEANRLEGQRVGRPPESAPIVRLSVNGMHDIVKLMSVYEDGRALLANEVERKTVPFALEITRSGTIEKTSPYSTIFDQLRNSFDCPHVQRAFAAGLEHPLLRGEALKSLAHLSGIDRAPEIFSGVIRELSFIQELTDKRAAGISLRENYFYHDRSGPGPNRVLLDKACEALHGATHEDAITRIAGIVTGPQNYPSVRAGALEALFTAQSPHAIEHILSIADGSAFQARSMSTATNSWIPASIRNLFATVTRAVPENNETVDVLRLVTIEWLAQRIDTGDERITPCLKQIADTSTSVKLAESAALAAKGMVALKTASQAYGLPGEQKRVHGWVS